MSLAAQLLGASRVALVARRDGTVTCLQGTLDPRDAEQTVHALRASGARGSDRDERGWRAWAPLSREDNTWLLAAGEGAAAPAVETLDALAQHVGALWGGREHAERLSLYESLLGAVGQAVIAFDTSGRYVHWNAAAHRLYGWSAEETLGRPAAERRIDAMSPEAKAHAMRTLAAQGMWQGEFLARHRDGSTFDAFTVNVATDIPGFGPVFIGVSHDIREVKAVQRELERTLASLREAHASLSRSERALAEAQRLASLGSYEYILDTHQLHGSAEWHRLYGFAPDAAVTIEEGITTVHPDDRDRVQEAIATALRELRPITCEWRAIRVNDGALIHVEGRGEPLLDAMGRCIGLRGTIQDVTQRRMAEAQLASVQERVRAQERLTMLGTLVAGVAHEINNPLTYIRGGNELALMTLQDVVADAAVPPAAAARLQEAAAQLHTALRGVEQVTGITRALGHIARAPDGPREPVRLGQLVSDVVAACAGRARPSLSLQCPPAADALVQANPSQLSQVLLNLILNAIDAVGDRPAGRIVVRVARDAQTAVVEVADDGPGVPEADRHQLFTPFFTTKPNGVGLGLSIGESIVRSHGGSLTYERADGWTVFRVRLPSGEAAARVSQFPEDAPL
ncbi:MAG TPA: PAS domain S-box protein [Candidatus Thermoplasmatota archaeon]|nr:PAS domain S-box protein [Candidatus Thermoplasmatota archaeon]